VTSVLVGARTKAQLADNLQAAEWEMSAEEVAELDDLTQPRPLFPHWHQVFASTLR
jgi:aryl-alcohol dehydrogenase-like predicted oxidoreductase